MSRAPKETAPLDPWASTFEAQEERALEQIKANARVAEREAQLSHQRKEMVWRGFGYALVGLALLATLSIVVGSILMTANANRKKSMIKSVETTKQIQACTRLEQPLERQYCLMRVDSPVAEERK